MKKDDCERAIRSFCHKWREECGLSRTPPDQLSFSDFISWVRQNYSSYLKFRTSLSVDYDAEMWFDQEFNQTWRR
jgi:hypothetical protein